MMAKVGVLCARMRVEERLCLEALASAGIPATLVHAGAEPLPPFPSPFGPPADSAGGQSPEIVIDRYQDRAAAGPLVALHRAAGNVVIDAGIATSRNRLEVSLALARAGVPRPVTALAVSEQTALQQMDRIGFPATLLPLAFDSPEVPLLDHDSAEAAIEHRHMLGCATERVSLLQSGVAVDPAPVTIIVIAGVAVATIGQPTGLADPGWLIVAEAAAAALDAAMTGIAIVDLGDGPIVWDVSPTPEFRHATSIGDQSVAAAIARMVKRQLSRTAAPSLEPVRTQSLSAREVFNGFILSA